MTTPQTIFNSLKSSFISIKDNRLLFLILFITESIFLITASALFVYYAIDIGDHAQKVVEPMQDIASEADLLSAIGNANFYSEYKAMLNSVFMFLLLIYLSYAVINGVNWDLSNLMVNRQQKFLFYELRFAALSFIFMLPLLAAVYFITELVLYAEFNLSILPVIAIIIFIELYFMYISFSLINEWKKPKEITNMLKKTFLLGIKQSKVLLPAYILALLSVTAAFSLLYAALEAPFILLIAAIVFCILAINWARLLMLAAVKEILDASD